MKTLNFQKSFLAIVAGLALSAMMVMAQNSPVNPAPPLSYGVPQILQLAQARVSDDTVIAYIRNSGNSYNLDADQIIYLRQQGISDNVINFMLNQPKAAVTPAPAATPPANSYTTQTDYAPQAAAAYTPPATTYVQSAPPSTVYVIPNTQAYYYNSYYAQPYYYPYYYSSYYPYYTRPYGYPYYARPYSAVSLSFQFGGGSYHSGSYGGGFHGGYSGGGYHGGGWHH